MADFSPYQQKIIKRYYNNHEAIQSQRLAELTTELYLADGKKRERLWKQVSESSSPKRGSRTSWKSATRRSCPRSSRSSRAAGERSSPV